MKKLILLFAALAISVRWSFAVESTFPAGEKWTESTSVKGEFGWGNYEGSQASISTDSNDKKAGNVSIKYSGINNKTGGALGPAIIFPKDHYIDITSFAGGNFNFDIKLSDVTNFSYMQLALMSDGVQAHQINRDIKLQAGWNHIQLPVAAKGGFKAAGWKGAYADEFNPAAVHQIRFRLIYRNGNAYDSAKPRDVYFDGVQFASTTSAPAVTENSQALKILESQVVGAEHRIDPGQSWKVDLPKLEDAGSRLLKITVRRDAPQLGGYGTYLSLKMNGQPVDAAMNRYASRLVNKPLSFTRENGQQVFWNQGDGIWMTIFAPDFTTSFKRYGPNVAEPYTYLLDVSDLVKKNGLNEVELSNLYPVYADKDRKNIPLFASVEWIAADVVNGETNSMPRPEVATMPKLTISQNGGIELNIGAKPLNVESTFSIPGGEEYKFGGSPNDANWKPKVEKIDEHHWRITAAGAFYSIVREITQIDGRISVQDTFKNRSTKDVGIIFSNYLNLADHPGINYCRIGGQRGQGIIDVLSRENPTLFFPLKNSSLTMIANDDVYRNQAVFYFDTTSKTSGMRDPMFAMAPGTQYTVKWSIYTLPDEKYFSMINRVRDDWNSNITLPDPVYFTNYRIIANMPEAQLKELVAHNNARYICFWEIHAPGNYPQWDGRTVIAEGPGIWNPIFSQEVELVKKATAKLHAISPDIKVALYSHSFFISPEQEDDLTYKDSWITNANGDRSDSHYNNATRYPFRTVFPTLKNSYGKVYSKLIDFYLNDLKLDWIYWDESNGPGVTVASGDKLEAYLTYNTWDGHSAKIDPKTGEIQEKCGFITLLSDEFINSIVNEVQKKGGMVLFNGAATTALRRRSPSFVETQDNITNAYKTNLNTPLAYGLGDPSMADLRRRLDFGLLYARTTLDYDSSIVTHFYPFTPMELHEGWVMGRERIITDKSGNFGWKDNPFTGKLYLYDAAGKLQKTQDFDTPQKSVSIDVPDDGIAILERTLSKG